jgi:hypothetical protein
MMDLDEYRFNEIWEDAFDFATDFYDRAINEMHRVLHPDQSLWYTKCFESPCKNL